MAIAELASEFVDPVEAAASSDGSVRVGIHDASRLEWSVSVPLPEDRPLKYSIDVEIQIPSNAFARHLPWDQMQSFTRLDGPAMSASAGEIVTIDALRRGAVGLANKLSVASDGFSRHCRLAGTLFATAPHAEFEHALVIWIDAALALAQDARARFACSVSSDPVELRRERELVDEYLSIRLLEMLAGAERALGRLGESRTRHTERFAPVVAAVEERVADALGTEVAYRAAKGYLQADPSSQAALERYLERSSRLKKHFQEVLFLEAETYQVADRIHNWVAAFVAVVASTWAFAWQIALINRAPTMGASLGSGLIVLAVIAGLVYAAKDRIKELGRTWISGKVHRVYGAQRIARYRAPARRLPGRDVIVSARESFDQVVAQLPDRLNPESGATLPVTLIRYNHKGIVSPQAQLTAAGVRRVKHVFRYDLSPLFTRLDDAVKPVPVLDGTSHRVRFIDAPRCYRIPISLKVTCGDMKWDEAATLVLHKRGLDRLERAADSDPDLADLGIDPL